MTINFDTTPEDTALIDQIVARARKFADVDQLDLSMDITATHRNGTPLDLQQFLDFDDFNFMHDIQGIRRHIDRTTGKLTGFFEPRCAR